MAKKLKSNITHYHNHPPHFLRIKFQQLYVIIYHFLKCFRKYPITASNPPCHWGIFCNRVTPRPGTWLTPKDTRKFLCFECNFLFHQISVNHIPLCYCNKQYQENRNELRGVRTILHQTNQHS